LFKVIAEIGPIGKRPEEIDSEILSKYFTLRALANGE
jgi:hypothetical protein